MNEALSVEYKGLPKSSYIEVSKERRWRVFGLSKGTIVLTDRGQEILSFNPELRRDLHGYRDEDRRHVQGIYRRPFKDGGNSNVYTLGGNPIVIKEDYYGYPVWEALNRMDYLNSICQEFLPPYIRVPDYYGILSSPFLRRQHTLIQKVGEGLTVTQLKFKKPESISEDNKRLVLKEYEGLLSQVRDAVKTLPENFLPDWHAGNVIVDFDSPAGEMPFTFWLIDQ